MIRSDYQCWSLLATGQVQALSPLEIYKACVIAANNGWKRNEEDHLPAYQQTLLQSRRHLKNNDALQANHSLRSLSSETPSSSIDAGDREFLIGMVYHRLGDLYSAVASMANAVKLFSESGDSHRLLRALINEKISASTSLQTYLSGDLYILQNQTIGAGYHDLAGNIFTARAGELIVSDKLPEAISEARQAINHYTIASCPEDLAQARMMLAISQALNGDTGGSKETLNSVHIRDGKISTYTSIIDTLLKGKRPVVAQGHPLYGTNWKLQSLKNESVTGKIIQALQSSELTRDELIECVWGKKAIDPSYCDRLYSAIKSLRKSGYQIIFDGEKYKLLR